MKDAIIWVGDRFFALAIAFLKNAIIWVGDQFAWAIAFFVGDQFVWAIAFLMGDRFFALAIGVLNGSTRKLTDFAIA